MTQFSENTSRLIALLKNYYSSDPDGMASLVALERSPDIIRQHQIIRENPLFVKIRDEIIPKLDEAYRKLTEPDAYKKTDQERAMHLATIAWGEWFLQALGDEPEKRMNSVENHIKRLAERAGVVSKE